MTKDEILKRVVEQEELKKRLEEQQKFEERCINVCVCPRCGSHLNKIEKRRGLAQFSYTTAKYRCTNKSCLYMLTTNQ